MGSWVVDRRTDRRLNHSAATTPATDATVVPAASTRTDRDRARAEARTPIAAPIVPTRVNTPVSASDPTASSTWPRRPSRDSSR